MVQDTPTSLKPMNTWTPILLDDAASSCHHSAATMGADLPSKSYLEYDTIYTTLSVVAFADSEALTYSLFIRLGIQELHQRP